MGIFFQYPPHHNSRDGSLDQLSPSQKYLLILFCIFPSGKSIEEISVMRALNLEYRQIIYFIYGYSSTCPKGYTQTWLHSFRNEGKTKALCACVGNYNWNAFVLPSDTHPSCPVTASPVPRGWSSICWFFTAGCYGWPCAII